MKLNDLIQGAANSAKAANPPPSISRISKISNESDGNCDLEDALKATCKEHGLDAAELRQELIDNGDWADLEPENVKAFVEAKARPQGSADELRAAIKNWCDVAGLPEARRRELLGNVANAPPALLSEETRYFRMRLDQHERAKAEGAI